MENSLVQTFNLIKCAIGGTKMSEYTQVKKPSMLGIITEPKKQFERIKIHPVFWGALVTATIFFTIGSLLTTLSLNVESMGDFTEEEKAMVKQLTTIGSIFRGIFSPVLTVLISSFVYLIVAKVCQSDVSFRQLFSMNTYIMIIIAMGLIFNGIMALLIGSNTELASTSLGSIMNVEGPIGALFEKIELFKIWSVIISAIGLQKVADLSKGVAWSILLTFFIVGVIFAMALAGINGIVGV